ncbi:MAG: hypothetical protein ACRD0V_09180 [Acidimicrobiales bacterium]
MATTVDRISRTARRRLGRRASRSTESIDWAAADAVKAAAVEHGLTEYVLESVRPGRTVRQLSGDLAARYSQAWGVQGDLPHVVTTQLFAAARASRAT